MGSELLLPPLRPDVLPPLGCWGGSTWIWDALLLLKTCPMLNGSSLGTLELPLFCSAGMYLDKWTAGKGKNPGLIGITSKTTCWHGFPPSIRTTPVLLPQIAHRCWSALTSYISDKCASDPNFVMSTNIEHILPTRQNSLPLCGSTRDLISYKVWRKVSYTN